MGKKHSVYCCRLHSCRNIKVHFLPGGTTHDMVNYLNPLLTKFPGYVILHVETNDAIEELSRKVPGAII